MTSVIPANLPVFRHKAVLPDALQTLIDGFKALSAAGAQLQTYWLWGGPVIVNAFQSLIASSADCIALTFHIWTGLAQSLCPSP